jgi:hypothetical protein
MMSMNDTVATPVLQRPRADDRYPPASAARC